MRDLLTGLAIILIVALTTVLVAPYFVDWNGQRGFLETRLSHAVGQKVTIGGGIDLKLLPTPYLVLDQVVVGADDGPVRISAHHLDLELTVTPLFHGEFDIVEARLEEPTIRVNLTHDRALPTLPPAPAFEADVRFDRIHVSDGTLAIADPQSGRSFVFDHLDLDADAGSFTGPLKVEGAGGAADARTRFRLATAPPEQGKAHARLVIDEAAAHPGFEFDGTIDMSGAREDAIRPTFLGTFVASGHATQAIGTDPVAWRLAGPLKADPSATVLAGGELRLGGEDANIRLQADATLDTTATPKLTFDVAAKQLDIDRLAGAPVDAARPPPPRLPPLSDLVHMIGGAQPPVATTLDVAVDKATWGGEALGAIEGHLGPQADGKQALKLSVDGPGGSHVAFDGHLASKDTLRYIGRLGLSAEDLGRLTDWLGRIAPSGTMIPPIFGLRTARVDGQIVLDADGIDADKLTATLDRSEIAGTVHLVAARGTQPTKIDAKLSAKTLDIDGLPSLADARSTLSAVDLGVQLDAKSVTIDGLGGRDLVMGPISAAITKSGERIAVDRLRAENLGGATVSGQASVDANQTHVVLDLDARNLETAADVWRQLLPGTATDMVAARASLLAPARVRIDATLPASSGASTPTALTIAGSLGATRIEAAMAPDAAAGASITATLDAPEGIALLHQLVPDAVPIGSIGASRIRLIAKGKPRDPLEATLVAQLGESHLEVAGTFDPSARLAGSGSLRLKSPDLGPILQSLAISIPDVAARTPADLAGTLVVRDDAFRLDAFAGHVDDVVAKGALDWRRGAVPDDAPVLTGRIEAERVAASGLVGLLFGHPQGADDSDGWSREKFADGLVDPPRTALNLKIGSLDLERGIVAHDVALDLDLRPNVMRLGNVKGQLAGGQATGQATLRRDGSRASVESKLSLDSVGLRLGDIRAKLTGTLDLAGGGDSAATLISSLAGSGEMTMADLSIPRADPAGFRKVFQDVESDALPVDQDVVVRALEDAGSAPDALGTRRYRLDLAAGVLRASLASPDDGGAARPVASRAEGSFDLGKDQIDLRLVQTLNALPKNWTGAPPSISIRLAGAAKDPVRSVDVSNFLNAVASRALARETARIEAYEFDIRERAFFNTRLQTETRRVEERQKAEDDAKKAEAERKARAEAARLERQRRDAAAKAARAAEEEQRRSANPQQPADPRASPPAPPAGQDPSTLGRY